MVAELVEWWLSLSKPLLVTELVVILRVIYDILLVFRQYAGYNFFIHDNLTDLSYTKWTNGLDMSLAIIISIFWSPDNLFNSGLIFRFSLNRNLSEKISRSMSPPLLLLSILEPNNQTFGELSKLATTDFIIFFH